MKPSEVIADAPGGIETGCGIYLILCLASGRAYVGQTRNLRTRRKHGHEAILRKGSHPNRHLQNAWNRYGAAAFTFHVLENCFVDALNDREAFWVAQIDRGLLYNLGAVGCVLPPSEESKRKTSQSLLGRPKSDQHRENISRARKGIRPPLETMRKAWAAAAESNRGRKRPAEAVEKGAAAIRGRTWTQEQRERASRDRTGRILTPEHRAKIAAALKGKPKSPEHVAHMMGRPVSEKTRQAASRAHKGKPVPAEVRQRISATLKGRPGRKDSPETKAKKSEAKRRYWASRTSVPK